MPRRHPRTLTVLVASLLLGALALTPGCDNIGSVTFTETSQEAVVDGGGLGSALPVNDLLPPMRLNVNLEEELDQQDAGPAEAVYLEALSLQITDTARPEGDTDDFDFIDEVEVYVESRQDDSELERRRVATLSDVPEGATTVDFQTDSDVDLKPYIEQGVLLVTEGSGEVPDDDTSFEAVVTMRAELL